MPMVVQQNQIRHANDRVSIILGDGYRLEVFKFPESASFKVKAYNRRDVLIKPNFLVANSGPILSVENFPRFLLTISPVERCSFSTAAAVPPIAFKTSSLSHVCFLFLYAIP